MIDLGQVICYSFNFISNNYWHLPCILLWIMKRRNNRIKSLPSRNSQLINALKQDFPMDVPKHVTGLQVSHDTVPLRELRLGAGWSPQTWVTLSVYHDIKMTEEMTTKKFGLFLQKGVSVNLSWGRTGAQKIFPRRSVIYLSLNQKAGESWWTVQPGKSTT